MIVTLYTKVEIKPASSWVDITAQVVSVRADLAISGNIANALAFGETAESRCTVKVHDTLYTTAWDKTPIRVTLKINGTDRRAFTGQIRRRKVDADYTMSFDCEGFTALLRTTKVYSPMFVARPAATKTTATSVEDPTSPSYQAGLINYALWQAGGRPLEQDFNAAYANATFWYSCDQAVTGPTYGWLAGEDAFAEIVKLCQAAGGQIYQDLDGTVRYRQPFAVAEPPPGALFVFDETVYGSAAQDAVADLTASTVKCTFVGREDRPMQEVINDNTTRFVMAGETVTIDLEPSFPLLDLELVSGNQLKDGAINYVLGVHQAGLNHSVTWGAQRVSITFSNPSTCVAQIFNITIRGVPVVAGEQGAVSYGSGATVRQIAENIYIQTHAQAERLARMVLAFYAQPRPIWSLSDCAPDPDRYVGEMVSFTRARYSISAQRCIILGISYDKSGQRVSYQLVPVDDLLYTSLFFEVGKDYAGVSKMLGY